MLVSQKVYYFDALLRAGVLAYVVPSGAECEGSGALAFLHNTSFLDAVALFAVHNNVRIDRNDAASLDSWADDADAAILDDIHWLELGRHTVPCLVTVPNLLHRGEADAPPPTVDRPRGAWSQATWFGGGQANLFSRPASQRFKSGRELRAERMAQADLRRPMLEWVPW
ncbi:hypothetical protein BST61_g6869 [Cercospora zeina]